MEIYSLVKTESQQTAHENLLSEAIIMRAKSWETRAEAAFEKKEDTFRVTFEEIDMVREECNVGLPSHDQALLVAHRDSYVTYPVESYRRFSGERMKAMAPLIVRRAISFMHARGQYLQARGKIVRGETYGKEN